MNQRIKDEKKKSFFINSTTQRLKQQLIKDIQESGLPIVNIYLLWDQLGREIERSYYEVLNKEAMELQKTEVLEKE